MLSFIVATVVALAVPACCQTPPSSKPATDYNLIASYQGQMIWPNELMSESRMYSAELISPCRNLTTCSHGQPARHLPPRPIRRHLHDFYDGPIHSRSPCTRHSSQPIGPGLRTKSNDHCAMDADEPHPSFQRVVREPGHWTCTLPEAINAFRTSTR